MQLWKECIGCSDVGKHGLGALILNRNGQTETNAINN